MKICPKCGAKLDGNSIDGYLCGECGGGIFSEDEVIVATCPICGDELGDLCDEYYCYTCSQSVSKEDADYSNNINFDDNYDSMIDNGDAICLNCTYWSVSPYGAAHGMVCRRGYPTDGPADSCSGFVQSHHFASYGDNGQYQFNETRKNTANKLQYWKNNR